MRHVETTFICYAPARSLIRDWGTAVATSSACGANWRKGWHWNREEISDRIQLTSNMRCCKCEWMSCHKGNISKRLIRLGSFAVSDFSTSTTTDLLPERNSTRLDDQKWPHRFSAMAIGNNSLYAMEKTISDTDHEPVNQWDTKKTYSARGILWNLKIWQLRRPIVELGEKLCPFHNVKNSNHQARSR